MKVNTLLLLLLTSASLAMAEDFEVLQKDKAFSTQALTVKVGDNVKFVNADSFNHNIFSLSDTKSFDLGSYPKGESKSVTFDAPGQVDVECALHPNMKMSVKVEP